MQSALQIYLLGSFRLSVKGAAVPNSCWQKRKAKLLLQILALQPQHEIHREELMEMLFPELDEKSASANLYRLLHAARRALEPERNSYASSGYVVTEGQQIKLTAEALWIDVEEFEQKAGKGLKTNDPNLLESAAELYRGDLLTDEPFEEWINGKRERFRTLFHRVLRRLAENDEKAGNTEEAHLWLDKLLSHEPADEVAHRAKMRLYEKQGERLLALKQYEKCREILKREFSVEPDEETDSLREQIFARKNLVNK